jgi:flagellar biosynthesis protein FlhA
MSIGDAVSSYSLLSVGDGLVSQIPALLLSVSTGLIVTRSADADDMGSVVARQLSGQSRALRIAGAAALLLCLVPGLPKLPFVLLGCLLLVVASRAKKEQQKDDQPAAQEATVDEDSPEALLEQAQIDRLELVLSADLVPLASAAGADLVDRVKALRRSLVRQLGMVMPPVRTRDDVTLPSATYAIRVNGVEVARGQAPPGTVLAIGDGLDGLPGRLGREPVFGVEGKWIATDLQAQAQLLGATVVDRSSVVITHLSEVVKTYASRLLGREEVAALVAAVKRGHPTVVEDLVPNVLTLGEVQRVLHGLLDEGVAIRDLVRILEALAIAAKGGTDPDRLIEAARTAVAPAIVEAHAHDGTVDVMMLDARIQQTMLESLRPADGGAQFVLPPGLGEHVIDRAQQLYREATELGRRPVLICAPQIRRPLRRLVAMAVPDLAVLSLPEITAGTARVETVGEIADVRDPFV